MTLVEKKWKDRAPIDIELITFDLTLLDAVLKSTVFAINLYVNYNSFQVKRILLPLIPDSFFLLIKLQQSQSIPAKSV